MLAGIFYFYIQPTDQLTGGTIEATDSINEAIEDGGAKRATSRLHGRHT